MIDKENNNIYNVCTEFGSYEWDPDKNAVNIEKHGISFEEAITIFNDDFGFTVADIKHSTDTESRFQAVGISCNLHILCVCHCIRNNDQTTRIISARKATKEEVHMYEQRLFRQRND